MSPAVLEASLSAASEERPGESHMISVINICNEEDTHVEC